MSDWTCEPRPLTDEEIRTLNLLLEPLGPDFNALRSQVPAARVVGGCGCGCPTVNFVVDSRAPRLDVRRGVATARISDSEEGLELILFVRNGMISSLELTYADTPLSRFPLSDHVLPPVWNAGL